MDQPGLPSLPPDIQLYITLLDRAVYLQWPLLCRQTALETRFDNNYDRVGRWCRYKKFFRTKQLKLVQLSNYKAKQLHGAFKKYHFPSGALQLEQHYHDGKIHGKQREYHKDGRVRLECTFVHGKKTGEVKEWLETGELWEHCFYKDGRLHGEFKRWWVGGKQLKQRVTYKNGLREGEYFEWDHRGTLRKTLVYLDGMLVKNAT